MYATRLPKPVVRRCGLQWVQTAEIANTQQKSPAEAGLFCWSPGSGGRFEIFRRLAQHIAAAPHRLDVVLAVGGGCELLAQLADEDVDDLQFRLVHTAIEMIEEHLFC